MNSLESLLRPFWVELLRNNPTVLCKIYGGVSSAILRILHSISRDFFFRLHV